MHLEVVQPGKDALFRDAQTARKDRKLEIIVCLEGVAKQIADEGHHLIVVPGLEGFVQGHIILVNQQNHLTAIMLGQQLGKIFKTACQQLILHVV